MGMKSKSGHFDSGDVSKREGNITKKIFNLWEDDPLYRELANSGNKFNKNEVIFVTKDKSSQLLWLEKGNMSTGLEHIVYRHVNDFQKLHTISAKNIVCHTKEIITNGRIEYTKSVVRNGYNGFEKLYNYNGEYYLLTGIGGNGYIISAYPISENSAKIYIRRNSNGKRNN